MASKFGRVMGLVVFSVLLFFGIRMYTATMEAALEESVLLMIMKCILIDHVKIKMN